MFVQDSEEVNQELCNILTPHNILPSFAVYYAFMDMMSVHENTYAISDVTIKLWYRKTFKDAHLEYHTGFKD